MISGQAADTAELRSGCKINLYLEITGSRPDGYHTLRSFMLPLPEPFDLLRVTPQKAQGERDGRKSDGTLEVICAEPGIDRADNTLTKAHKLLMRARPELAALPGLTVELVKGVPHGAGLGGGSANAAALLLYLNGLLEHSAAGPLSKHELIPVAAKVGADVPFFILNTPAWAEGIGDELVPAEAPRPELHIVLVCPDIRVSTAWAFGEWDRSRLENVHSAKTGGAGNPCLTSPPRQDTNFPAAGFTLYNSLEPVVFRAFPRLAAIKRDLDELGAAASLMSGSGSSVFGLFPSRQTAEQAAFALRDRQFTVFTQSVYTGASPSW